MDAELVRSAAQHIEQIGTEQAFRPSCPLCGAFTRVHDDGCWSCSRCGTSGDTGTHQEDAHS